MTVPFIPDPDDFPRDGSNAEKLRFLVHYAVLAPSSHNSQPWFFLLHDDWIELHADRTRALPVTDPHDRELVISCGACLFYLRVAAAKFGVKLKVQLNEDDNDALTRLHVDDSAPDHPSFAALFDAIPTRVTNRFPYKEGSVNDDQLAQLAEISGAHRIKLVSYTDDQRKHDLAEMIAEGDRAQMQSDSWRRELASWLHHNRSRTLDGMPGYTQGMGEIMSLAAPLVVRTFDLGKGAAAKDLELAEHSPALCVFGSQGDHNRDWLHTGEALAHVLLKAGSEGLSASFLNQPVEVDLLRTRLSKFTNLRWPQLLIRLGRATREAKSTPRRPAGQVILDANELHGDDKAWQGF